MTPFRKILVPVDFSSCSERAVRYAAHLAAQTGAQLELLHVVEPEPPVLVPDAVNVDGWPPFASIEEDREKYARARLEAALPTLAGGAIAGVRVEYGDPASRVVDEVERGGFDLVVLGSHGRGGLKRLVLGSVADHVLRNAPCPVLTIRDCPEMDAFDEAPGEEPAPAT